MVGARPASRRALKPMTSQVNWALLGLLIERPGYGYQLVQRFELAYGDVLTLGSHSHIYTALNELKRRRLIEAVSVGDTQGDTDRQPRPRYQATDAGARSYREWMFARAREDRRQSRLFVRQLAVFEYQPQVALEILDGYERACLAEARQMPHAHERLADRLVGEESRLAIEARLPWVEYARAEFGALKAGEDEPARG